MFMLSIERLGREEEKPKEVNGYDVRRRCRDDMKGRITQAIVRVLRTLANDPHPPNSRLQAFVAM